MNRKRHQMMNILIAVVVLLSGSCFHSIDRDALFMYASNINETAQTEEEQLLPSTANLEADQACTEEIIRSGDSAVGQFVKGYHKNEGSNAGFNFLAQSYDSLQMGNVFINSYVMMECHHDHQDRITRYIHKSDGKKENA